MKPRWGVIYRTRGRKGGEKENEKGKMGGGKGGSGVGKNG